MEQKIKKLTGEEFDELVSWVIMAWTSTMNDNGVRRLVMETILKSANINDIYIGESIDPSYERYGAIKTFMQNSINLAQKNNYNKFVVTLSNIALLGSETHYVLVAVDILKRTGLILDPSFPGGIWDALELHGEIIKQMQNLGPMYGKYDIKTWNTNVTLQINDRDVFCQTWTLFLFWKNICQKQNVRLPDLNEILDPYETRLLVLYPFIRKFLTIKEVRDKLISEFVYSTRR